MSSLRETIEALRAQLGVKLGSAFVTPEEVIVSIDWWSGNLIMVKPGCEPCTLAFQPELEDGTVTVEQLVAKIKAYATAELPPFGKVEVDRVHKILETRYRVILGEPRAMSQTGEEYKEIIVGYLGVNSVGELADKWVQQFDLTFAGRVDNPHVYRYLYVRIPVDVGMDIVNDSAPLIYMRGRYLLSSVEAPAYVEKAA